MLIAYPDSMSREFDLVVALAAPAHRPHAVNHRRLDLAEALVSIDCMGDRAERRGDGVIGCISKDDANNPRLWRMMTGRGARAFVKAFKKWSGRRREFRLVVPIRITNVTVDRINARTLAESVSA
jgi:hypothetical protein